MTRDAMKKLTAITLCMIMVLCSMCTVACVTDKYYKNAQFFAADFSTVSTPVSSTSLSGEEDGVIVSWIRNPVSSFESQTLGKMEKISFSYFTDKLESVNLLNRTGFYDNAKTTQYVLRI